MSELNAVVAVYGTHIEAEGAVKALQRAGIDMRTLSIVGKDPHADELVVGYYNTCGRMKYWSKAGASRGGFLGLLFGSAFMLRTAFCCLLLAMIVAPRGLAQCSLAPPAPSSLSTMCNEMQGYLTSFQGTLSSQWNGQKTSVPFGAELLNANDSYGLAALLAPDAYTSIVVELNAFAQLGVQSVTFPNNFPVLYEPFYSFQGVNYSASSGKLVGGGER